MTRKNYPSDVSDEEWAFVAPYLTLMKQDAPQRHHDLREVFDALRWMVRSGSAWRYLPHDFPRWDVVYQQAQRWLRARVFEAMVHDLRLALRLFHERKPTPSAAIYDSRTLSSTPESAARAERERGSTDTRRQMARRFISRSILWDICWHSRSRQPMKMTAHKSKP